MDTLFSEYKPVVVIGKSSTGIHDLFSSYMSILVISNKLKVISTPFVVLSCFSLELRAH